MTRYIYSVSGDLVAEYVERTSAGIVAAIDPPPGRQYVFADHLGSTRLVTDATGACQKRTDYQPFGAEIPRTAELAASTLACYAGVEAPAQMFTDKERDAETGLDYFGARYLSAAQGRFTSPDIPLIDQHVQDPQSWNLYSYVRNNPLRYTDPTGRCLRPNETLESCGDYLIGGAKAIGNIPSDIVNSPNRLANVLIAPFTDFQFSDLIPTTFTPSNENQRQGMEAMGVAMAVTPVAEAAAGKVAQATGAGVAVETGAAAPKAGVQANKVTGDAFRDQVAAGLSAEGRGVQKEVYKSTPFGGRRIDVEVSDKPGGTVLGGIETKAGNSPYKPSQRAKDEYLRRQGYPVNVVREPKKR